MSVKFFIYLFVSILVVWAMEAVNINQIFRKNRVLQARVFYLLLGLSMIYLVSNFVFDFFVYIIGKRSQSLLNFKQNVLTIHF